MKRTFLLLLSIAVSQVSMAQFTADNLVVVKATSPYPGTPTNYKNVGSVSLVELNTSAPNQTGTETAIPNFLVGQSASTLSTGYLKLSSDRNYLTMYGYNLGSLPADAANGNLQPSTNSRTLVVVDVAKTVSSINIPNIPAPTPEDPNAVLVPHSGTHPRSAIAFYKSANTYGVYFAGGSGVANGGILYTELNTVSKTLAAPTQIADLNTGSISIFNGELNSSTGATNNPQTNMFNQIGSGLPTSAATAVDLTAKIAVSPVIQLPGDFVFFGNNLLYIADETATTGGIYKFYSADNGVTWTAKGKVDSGISGDLFFRGMTGRLEDGKPTLYAVTSKSKGNNVVKIIDKTAANSTISNTITDATVSVLATATSSTSFRGISFTPGSTITLPIALDNFTAKNVNGAVELNWSTASEQNNRGFEVQHSTDGQTFTTIGEVKGNNNSSAKNTYSFTDKGAVAGTNYYQLKQVDNNGDFKIYGPKAVSISFSTNDLSVYANSSSVNVNLNSALNLNNVSITVVNANGQKVASSNVQLVKGANAITIPAMLTKGVYVLNIQGDGLNDVKKFIVK
ncbi:T9SS type A sorting domain-containing protein [Pedobacter arcticus]|uniref:T9SS type A sorting domain-containing protein n=1 Tax=Pedobacter arcticus TaxID=752140 RepID=UPI00030DED82|nr:T9SS type A sorting domain-containing protein [Pedobacter arcticus]